MRKILHAAVPVALAIVATTANADDGSATLYGILDTAIANIAHGLNFDDNHPVANNPNVTKGTQAVTGMLNGGMSATRWGMKGDEDLGAGFKAVFLLEQGFNVGSGNVSNAVRSLANNSASGPGMSADSAISGQFFNRGAYAGLSSATWGTLTAGRHQSFFLDNIASFDPMMGSQAFSPIGFSGTYGGGGATDDSRVDNSLKYKIAAGDFTLGALYKFGGIAGISTAATAYELNAVYASGPLSGQLGYQGFKDAFAISNAAGGVTDGKRVLESLVAQLPGEWPAGIDRVEFVCRGRRRDPGNATEFVEGAQREIACRDLVFQTVVDPAVVRGTAAAIGAREADGREGLRAHHGIEAGDVVEEEALVAASGQCSPGGRRQACVGAAVEELPGNRAVGGHAGTGRGIVGQAPHGVADIAAADVEALLQEEHGLEPCAQVLVPLHAPAGCRHAAIEHAGHRLGAFRDVWIIGDRVVVIEIKPVRNIRNGCVEDAVEGGAAVVGVRSSRHDGQSDRYGGMQNFAQFQLQDP